LFCTLLVQKKPICALFVPWPTGYTPRKSPPAFCFASWLLVDQLRGIVQWYVYFHLLKSSRFLTPLFFETSAQFLEMFRRNLAKIEIDFTPYGTHSFRRGGCQYLASVRRWLLRRICEWGGWSTEFSNMTIVKYLISWSDDPTETREEFFNPKRVATVRCPHCGRSCCCS